MKKKNLIVSLLIVGVVSSSIGVSKPLASVGFPTMKKVKIFKPREYTKEELQMRMVQSKVVPNGVSRYDYENKRGNQMTVTIDLENAIYTLKHSKASYHTHTQMGLDELIKLYQNNIDNDFKDWEDITNGEEYYYYEALYDTKRYTQSRNLRVNTILRVDELRANGWQFYSEYQDKWIGLTNEQMWEQEAKRDKMAIELKEINGFDIDKNIDNELIYGKDWKCKIK